MELSTNYFMRSPGGENEGDNIIANNNNDNKTTDVKATVAKEDQQEKTSFIDKIHDALQEWSNDDQRDQEFDDTRP